MAVKNDRIKVIRETIAKKKLDALLVTHVPNVTYITGFQGEDSWAIVTPRAVYLLTDSRYIEQAEKECKGVKIVVRKKGLIDELRKIVNRNKSCKKIGMENTTQVAVFKMLKSKLDVSVKAIGGIVEKTRECKQTAEVKMVRKAAVIAGDALKKVKRFFKAGITETELAGRLEFEIRKAGGETSFDTIVAFGPNGSRPHHKPSSRKLRKNDTILIDYGVKLQSYCCDITRCFVVGKCSAKYRKAYNAVRIGQEKAKQLVKEGVSIKELDTAARKIIRENGFPVYGHGTGHGLGLEVHEKPILAPRVKGKLKTGQLITIEPGIYLPGEFGIRIEDDVLVTEKGSEVLTENVPIEHL